MLLLWQITLTGGIGEERDGGCKRNISIFAMVLLNRGEMIVQNYRVSRDQTNFASPTSVLANKEAAATVSSRRIPGDEDQPASV